MDKFMENMAWVVPAMVAMSAFLAWFVKVTIKTELSDFKNVLNQELEKKFFDARVADVKMNAVHDRLDVVEEALRELKA